MRNTIILMILFLISLSIHAQDVQENPVKTTFIKKWLLVGPFPIQIENWEEKGEPRWMENTKEQREAFDFNFLAQHGGEKAIHPTAGLIHKHEYQNYEWKWYQSQNIRINLWDVYGEKEHCVAYAYAEIESSSDYQAFFQVGSDDALKIWLNDEQVYSFWGGRQLQVNQDSVPITLKAGTNRILLKILNMNWDWEFALKVTNPQDMPISHTLGDMFTIDSTRSPEEIRWRIIMVISITAFILTAIILIILYLWLKKGKRTNI